MKPDTPKILTAVVLAAVLAVASTAFAGWGHGGGHMGYGPRHHGMTGTYGDCGPSGGDYGPGRRYAGDSLTPEQIEQMEAQRSAFFQETEPLRQRIYEREMALRSELAKQQPDTETARSLQKEVSDLRGEFDLKRLEHRMEMRKIAPDAGRGYAGYGRGPRGGGYGKGPHRGGYGPGACWR